jgi:UDP-glucose 4-epimerase
MGEHHQPRFHLGENVPLTNPSSAAAALAGTRALITGGLGFIGSNLAQRLTSAGVHVTILDNVTEGSGAHWANLDGFAEKVDVRVGDVRDPRTLAHCLKDASIVFNLAAQTSHMGSMADPRTDLAINTSAQLELLETCRHTNPTARVVYASTRQVYGVPDTLPVAETHPLRPVDVNGINKISGEFYHTLYSNVYDVRSTVLRLTNTYGPRMRIADAKQMFFGAWVGAALSRRTFEVWAPDELRDFTFVDDAVDALITAGVSDIAIGKVYNIGGFGAVRLRDLADLLVREVDKAQYVIKEFPADRKKIDIGSYYADDSLFRRDTGWCPKTELRDGVHSTVEYYKNHVAEYIDGSTSNRV